MILTYAKHTKTVITVGTLPQMPVIYRVGCDPSSGTPNIVVSRRDCDHTILPQINSLKAEVARKAIASQNYRFTPFKEDAPAPVKNCQT